jgi:hypothetical protein
MTHNIVPGTFERFNPASKKTANGGHGQVIRYLSQSFSGVLAGFNTVKVETVLLAVSYAVTRSCNEITKTGSVILSRM